MDAVESKEAEAGADGGPEGDQERPGSRRRPVRRAGGTRARACRAGGTAEQRQPVLAVQRRRHERHPRAVLRPEHHDRGDDRDRRAAHADRDRLLHHRNDAAPDGAHDVVPGGRQRRHDVDRHLRIGLRHPDLGVLRPRSGAGHGLPCSDDANQTQQSAVSFPTTAGRTYLVQVGGCFNCGGRARPGTS